MNSVEAGAVIIGFVNGVRLIQEKNLWGFTFFLIALVTGIVLGFLGYFGLTVETGILVGLGSSGVYRGLQVVGATK